MYKSISRAQKKIKNEGKPPKNTGRGKLSAAALLKSDDSTPDLPIELHQLLLNIFQNSFPERFGVELPDVVQDVKGHLFNRDFMTAFGKDEYLEAYAVRWSASRALGYVGILQDVLKRQRRYLKEHGEAGASAGPLKMTCLGGGAGAEIVALAGALKLMESSTNTTTGISEEMGAETAPESVTGTTSEDAPELVQNTTSELPADKSTGTIDPTEPHRESSAAQLADESARPEDTLNTELAQLKITHGSSSQSAEESVKAIMVDVANWTSIHQKLNTSINTAPPISAYASAALKAANVPLLPPNTLRATFTQADVLALDPKLSTQLMATQDIITLFFTLNELYSTSLPNTQAFLHRLTEAVKPQSLFLVVDSAGSYSTVSLNGSEKRYPMHWLLDHALLKTKDAKGEEEAPKWKKIQEEESLWFRVPEGLKYPLELENMRFQLHLYRRL